MTARAPKAAGRAAATRRRILEAAGRLFAARGYHAVGFRDIAAAARVSLRMPNHHFGSKRKLFTECIRFAFREGMKFTSLFADRPSFSSLPAGYAAIRRNVRACFFAVQPASGRPSWCGDLVARALTENLDDALAAMQDGLQPARDWFSAALQAVRPGRHPGEFVLWYVSLWAQISFYVTARPAILARLGKRRYDKAFLKAAADHLARGMLRQLDYQGG